ncbi:MAG TPA: FGGY-family carbohydrate kinase, partial [Spirochaetia bacterium]|nr:FGGY-family carbohydrate kinase [Spirochaetia bacterium]
HVNHTAEKPRYGVLMCVNGTGILYSWIRRLLFGDTGAVPYDRLNQAAAEAPVGSDGMVILPYGNGAERTLENRNPGASFLDVDFNRHGIPHLLRSAQEGIAFAFQYGLRVMRDLGIEVRTVKAGDANLFRSPLFREAFATVSGTRVELYETDGAQGAARGAGVGAGIYRSPKEAFVGLAARGAVEPDPSKAGAYADAYGRWETELKRVLR